MLPQAENSLVIFPAEQRYPFNYCGFSVMIATPQPEKTKRKKDETCDMGAMAGLHRGRHCRSRLLYRNRSPAAISSRTTRGLVTDGKLLSWFFPLLATVRRLQHDDLFDDAAKRQGCPDKDRRRTQGSGAPEAPGACRQLITFVAPLALTGYRRDTDAASLAPIALAVWRLYRRQTALEIFLQIDEGFKSDGNPQ